MSSRYALGFDFGTESVRVVIVNVRDGTIAGQSSRDYAHGVLDRALPTGETLPPDYALQHPQDWLDDSATACRAAIALASVSPEQIVGIGVAFTSCTMLPTLRDGTPLCLLDRFTRTPLAWPKLWKHHAAKDETDRINHIARERNEPWLARYGGKIGIEWFFPKIVETLTGAPDVYDATEVWIEAGDWLVWQLTGQLTRSTCQAGYKACWNRHTGFPSRDFFQAVHPKLTNVVLEKLPGTINSPGRKSGGLSPSIADRFTLRAETPVSTAIIDAHAGVPGAGVASPSTMVMVIGTSSCHMMNSRIEALAPGIAGVVEDGILPGYFGYETGQASVGDAFDAIVKLLGSSHDVLSRQAAELPPGSNGVIALDWLNGCVTPLMDGRLSDAFLGMKLSTQPAQLYRATIEATAFGVRRICDTLRDAGVPVRRFVASGGLSRMSPLLMQIYADVLDARIRPAASNEPVALGAAILGALAAGMEATGHASVSQAIHAMAPRERELVYRPDLRARKQYDELYPLYRQLAQSADVQHVMRNLSRGL